MQTRVQKWGNSLAIRIPKVYATESRLEPNTVVDVRLVDGQLVVTPVPSDNPTLEDLVAGITDKNRHEEVDFGPALGRERWWA